MGVPMKLKFISLLFIAPLFPLSGYSQARIGSSQIRSSPPIMNSPLPRASNYQPSAPAQNNWSKIATSKPQPLVPVGAQLTLPMFKATNQIIFDKLLSVSNQVLMTKAEFRFAWGTNVYFKNDSDYKSFAATALNSNTFTRLKFTPESLQAACDQNAKQHVAYQEQKSQYDADVKAEQARQAEIAKSRQAAIDAAMWQQQQQSQPQIIYVQPPPNRVSSWEHSGLVVP